LQKLKRKELMGDLSVDGRAMLICDSKM
jgi:hypothetical protein